VRQSRSLTCGENQDKGKDSHKVTKVLYFAYLGRTRRRTDLPLNLHVNEILRGYDSTGGVGISIFQLIFERPLQQYSATALSVMK